MKVKKKNSSSSLLLFRSLLIWRCWMSNSRFVIFLWIWQQVALPADEDYLPLKPRIGKAAKVCSLCVCLLVCFGIRNQTQDLAVARKVLCRWTTSQACTLYSEFCETFRNLKNFSNEICKFPVWLCQQDVNYKIIVKTKLVNNHAGKQVSYDERFKP